MQTTKNAAGLSKAKKTKKDRLCTLMRRKSGASIATLQRELGWQQHTVRAAISGVRKTGETVKKQTIRHRRLQHQKQAA